MLATLACLIALTLAGGDGPAVPSSTMRADAPRLLAPVVADEIGSGSTSSTPLDDEVEEFPDEPEGDDEEDPGEAMGRRGPSPSPAPAAIAGALGLPVSLPASLVGRAIPARPQGSTLSLLCRLRF